MSHQGARSSRSSPEAIEASRTLTSVAEAILINVVRGGCYRSVLK